MATHLIQLQVALERIVVVAHSCESLVVGPVGLKRTNSLEDGAGANHNKAALRTTRQTAENASMQADNLPRLVVKHMTAWGVSLHAPGQEIQGQ